MPTSFPPLRDVKRDPHSGDAVRIYCGGKRTWAIFTRFGWRCYDCGEAVEVVAE